jgi:homoserine kinase
VTPADLVERRVEIEAPASTANLGAGFDVLAMALDLVNVVSVEAVEGPAGTVTLTVHGEGAGELPADRGNRLVQALETGLREAGIDPTPLAWRVEMRNAIPMSRGLGSSASATVAGLLAARVLSGGGSFPDERVLALAAGLEGHPDNVAAALYGGFVVVGQIAGTPRAVRFDPPDGLLAALFIPERPLATSRMRAALPSTVPFADAVHNVGASSLAVAAIASGRLELLAAATEDRLHEPYRSAVYPELPALVGAAREAGALGACLSGAGSTVIAFAGDPASAARIAAALGEAGAALGLAGSARVTLPRAAGATLRSG